MKELVVVSGKGGTGKTSLVAALAQLAPDKVLADCDVDAADLHLVLQPRIEHREDFVSGHLARVQADRCQGCGECVEACRYEAVQFDNNLPPVARIVPYLCEGCGVCARVCPQQAITFEPRHCGELFISATPYGSLVHAQLDVAAENSGKLVTRVRHEAHRLAAAQGCKLVIVDGPPGIGCPVIASIGGADLVLAVTEPSVAGRHDLERLVELTGHFGIATAVCINKHDLAPSVSQELRDWCTDRGLPVLGEVPYDPQVTAAQMAGLNVVALGSGPAADAMTDIWKRTAELLTRQAVPCE